MDDQMRHTFLAYCKQGQQSALTYCDFLVSEVFRHKQDLVNLAATWQKEAKAANDERDAANVQLAITKKELENTKQQNQWLIGRVTELEAQDVQQLAADNKRLGKICVAYKDFTLKARAEAHKWCNQAKIIHQENVALQLRLQQFEQAQQGPLLVNNNGANQLSAALQEAQQWPPSNNNNAASQLSAAPQQTACMQPAPMQKGTMQQAFSQTYNPPQLAGQKRKSPEADTGFIDLTNDDDGADLAAAAAAAPTAVPTTTAAATPAVPTADDEAAPVETEVVFINADDDDDHNNDTSTVDSTSTATTAAATATPTGDTPISTPDASTDQQQPAKRRKLATVKEWAVLGDNPALCAAMGSWTTDKALEEDKMKMFRQKDKADKEKVEKMVERREEKKKREREEFEEMKRKRLEEEEKRELALQRREEKRERLRLERLKKKREEARERERERKEAEEVAELEGLLGRSEDEEDGDEGDGDEDEGDEDEGDEDEGDEDEDAPGETDEERAGELEVEDEDVDVEVEGLADGEDFFGDPESEEE